MILYILIDNESDKYVFEIDKILKNELSDNKNYLEKIKNHNVIFDNINWFKEPLSKPVENLIESLI